MPVSFEKFSEFKVPREGLHIFESTPREVTNRDLLQAVKKFGIKTDLKKGTFLQDKSRIAYLQDQFEVTIYYASGAVKFLDRAHYQVDDRKSTITYNKEEAEQLARQYIKKNKVAPVSQLKLFKISRLHVASLERETGRSEERVTELGVIFARMVDGIPIDGPGGKVIVHLNPEKQVTGCEYCWRNWDRIKSQVKEIRPIKFVKEAVINYVKPSAGVHVEVNEFRFGYFEEDIRTEQQYLQPVYIVILTISSGIGETTIRNKKVVVLPAAINHVGAIMRPRRRQQKKGPDRG
jgi:hypothetical protein